MHLFEEEINLFIGYRRDLADFIPIVNAPDEQKADIPLDEKNYLCFFFFGGEGWFTAVIHVWGIFILGRQGLHLLKRILCKVCCLFLLCRETKLEKQQR